MEDKIASYNEHFTATKEEYCLSPCAMNTYSDTDTITTDSNETRGQVHVNYMAPDSQTNSNVCDRRW
jgi:hypothetical protein